MTSSSIDINRVVASFIFIVAAQPQLLLPCLDSLGGYRKCILFYVVEMMAVVAIVLCLCREKCQMAGCLNVAVIR